MPELPEVETVRRGLSPAMQGKRIERLEVNRPDLRFPFPDRFRERVEGARIVHM
ncbi:MAG: DNA-formamidopyrimidine glycosylase, partial [Henriciella sp.]|nr:DNA-formamidopyrimidine glycosylase [Henriciella sp.]